MNDLEDMVCVSGVCSRFKYEKRKVARSMANAAVAIGSALRYLARLAEVEVWVGCLGLGGLRVEER